MENKTRIELLKEEAAALGITHSPNIGADTLQSKINKFKADQPKTTEVQGETKAQLTERKIKEATKLVRVVVNCMNQAKLNDEKRQGEYFMASNAAIGVVKKFVPYGVPTHVEKILLNVIEEKTYQQRTGEQNRNTRNVKEFNVEILPDLTPKEVEELKKLQEIRNEAAQL